MSSTTWEAFENEISDLCGDVRSTKVPVRSKAIDRIDQILNSREKELLDTKHVNISWIELFESICEAMTKVKLFKF